MKSRLWCAAALSALAGCSDSTTESPPEPRAITAREALTLRAVDGERTAFPSDLDAAVVQIYALDEAGAWTVYAGEGASDGTLRVDGVPAGGGWLRIDYFDPSPEARPRNEYFWIDGDADLALELGVWQFGRADVEHARTSPTETQIEWGGLVPWQEGFDLAVLYEPNTRFAQAFSQDLEGISGMPRAGDTAASLRVDWAGALAAPLLDASRGDRAVAMQLRFREVGGMFVGSAIRAAQVPAFSQVDGGTASFAVTLGGATPLKLRAAMDRDAFDALRPAIGREVGPAFGRGFAISASPTPVTGEFSLQSFPGELAVVDGGSFADGGLLDLGDLDVASPFPRDTVYGSFISGYPVTVARDDGAVALAQAQVGALTPELPTAGAPARPIIGPVRDVTIAGRPAFDGPTGVGLTPELRWTPPELGTPVEYEVKILAPGGVDPTYDFVWFPSAIFHVPGDQTSLVLPPETLEPGLPYAIAIRAITSGLSLDQHAVAPRSLALPYGWADTITPAFKP